MTALQEAAMRKALEALETCSYGDYSAKHVVDPSFDGDAVEAAIESLKAALAQQGEPEPKLWLWKNFVDGKQEYWVFDNLYPININDDDPQTLGDPCGYALFKPSRNGRKDTQ